MTALAERLGVPLSDVEFALAAVTHKSYVNEHRGDALHDNERLEFLGDAVIDLAVSHRLMERFPEAREGELSKIRASLVDEPALARLARVLDLGSLLRLGRGEELTGGREKSSLLADAMEAVIAAVYLSGGLAPVLTVVDRFLGEAFERAAAGTLDRDYKTQFQELAQSRLRTTPRYRVVAEHGPDHSKVFDVELELRGEVVGRGAGRSKKDAEQAAAKIALEGIQARHLEVSLATVAADATPREAERAPEGAGAPLMLGELVSPACAGVASPGEGGAAAAGDVPRGEPEADVAPEPQRAPRASAAPAASKRTPRKPKVATAKASPRRGARAKTARGAAAGRGGVRRAARKPAKR